MFDSKFWMLDNLKGNLIIFLFQVIAAPYNDHLCLAVARELEKVFGGWVPPS